jgi:hypothetical protein
MFLDLTAACARDRQLSNSWSLSGVCRSSSDAGTFALLGESEATRKGRQQRNLLWIALAICTAVIITLSVAYALKKTSSSSDPGPNAAITAQMANLWNLKADPCEGALLSPRSVCSSRCRFADFYERACGGWSFEPTKKIPLYGILSVINNNTRQQQVQASQRRVRPCSSASLTFLFADPFRQFSVHFSVLPRLHGRGRPADAGHAGAAAVARRLQRDYRHQGLFQRARQGAPRQVLGTRHHPEWPCACCAS